MNPMSTQAEILYAGIGCTAVSGYQFTEELIKNTPPFMLLQITCLIPLQHCQFSINYASMALTRTFLTAKLGLSR